MSPDNLWDVVKTVKLETSLDKSCGKDSLYSPPKGFSRKDNTLSQVLAVEEKLGIESSEQNFENMTRDDLEIAAQMYIYLVMCPATDDSSIQQWFNSWLTFYKSFFATESPDQIILTLNRMTKVKPLSDKDGKVRAEKLFRKATSLLNLNYGDFQRLLPRGTSNVSLNMRENDSIHLDPGGTIILFAFKKLKH